MEILRRLIYLAPLFSIFLVSGCNNENAPDCFKESGKLETVTITTFDSFETLVIHDDISVEIIETENDDYFELSYGKNLLSKVDFESINDSLLVYNNNRCGWVRNFNKPELKWYTSKATNTIISLSIGKIRNKDTLRNNLQVRTENAISEVNLTVNNNYTRLSSNSATNFAINGFTDKLQMISYFGDGQYDSKNLVCREGDILQRGYNDMWVNAVETLKVRVENAGTVYYTGEPDLQQQVSNGGKLVYVEAF